MSSPAAKRGSLAARLGRRLFHDHSGTRAAKHVAQSHRPWSIAARMWRAVHDRRAIRPRAALYLAAGALGIAIGTLVGVFGMRSVTAPGNVRRPSGRLGMRWWLPAVALPAAVWVATMSSVVWFPGGRSARIRDLWASLVGEVDPDRGRAIRQGTLRDRILHSGLPLFEAVDWPGTVTLRGWGGSPERIEHLELGLAARRHTPPVVALAMWAESPSLDDEARVRGRCVAEAAHLFRSAAQSTVLSPAESHSREPSSAKSTRVEPPHPEPPQPEPPQPQPPRPEPSRPEPPRPGAESADGLRLSYRSSMEAAEPLPWFPTAINLDDRVVEGRAIESGGARLAYYSLPGAWLTVTALHGEQPVLRSVADRAAFVASLVK